MENLTIENQVFNKLPDGQLEVLTPVQHKAVYSRKQLEDLREQRQTELVRIIALLAKMEELGIE